MLGAFLFWLAFAVLGYQYVGYPLALAAIAALRGKQRPTAYAHEEDVPRVTLVISAYNEEEVLEGKIRNALALSYPKDRLEIVVSSAGSTDAPNEIARAFAADGVVLHDYPVNRGKNLALNDTLPRASGDVIVFTDAN